MKYLLPAEAMEPGAHYSIKASARCCRSADNSMPSSFAVRRSMTNSYRVGSSTGMSAGFAPCRILLTATRPGADRIGARREDNRDAACGVFGCERSGRAGRHDHIGFERNELGRQCRKACIVSFGPTKHVGDVLSLDMTKLLHSLLECIDHRFFERQR